MDVNSDSDDSSQTGPSTSVKRIKIEQKTSKKVYEQKFKSEWLQQPQFKGWLAEHPTNIFLCKCIACNCELKCGKSELEKHKATKKHNEKVKKHQSIPSIASYFEKNTVHSKKVTTAEIKLANFFGHHNVSFQIVDHLVPVLKECFPDSAILKDCTLGRTKVTGVIKNVIAEKEIQDLSIILQKQKFSVLVDESTDISLNKLLCVIVKFVDLNDGKITDRLLELINVDAKNCDAAHLYFAVKQCLGKKNIPVKNIIGMASDNASVVIGKNNSFMTSLLKETQALVVLPCLCHSSALVASKACSKLPRTAEDLVKNIASFFSMSAKRTAELKEMQDFFKLSQLKMLKLAATRWLSLQHAVQRIVENWQVLLNYFRLTKLEDTGNKTVDFILEQLTNPQTKAFLLFLKYFLAYFNTFNALFQNKKNLIHILSQQCRKLFKEILSHFIKPEFRSDFKLNLKHPYNFLPLESINLGAECNQYILNLPIELKNDIKKTCLEFLITAASEIQKRFPLDDKFFEGLIFLSPDYALSSERPQNIKTLQHVYEKFVGLENINQNEIEREWNRLMIYFDNTEKDNFLKKSIEDFWWSLKQLKDFEDNFIFKNICSLASLCLSLPHSNAETERVFSVVTDVKTKKRNKLGSEALNAVSLIRFSGDSKCCKNFEVTTQHFKLMQKENLYK